MAWSSNNKIICSLDDVSNDTMRISNVTAFPGPALTPQAKILGLPTELLNRILYTAATSPKTCLNVALTSRTFRAIVDSIAFCINLTGRCPALRLALAHTWSRNHAPRTAFANLAQSHQIRTNEVPSSAQIFDSSYHQAGLARFPTLSRMPSQLGYLFSSIWHF